jgi:hypothetical protein
MYCATIEHSRLFYLENYARMPAFSPDLQRVCLHAATEFLHYSTTIKLLLLLKLIKGSYPSLRVLLRYLQDVIYNIPDMA